MPSLPSSDLLERWLGTARLAAHAAAAVHQRWAGRVGVGEARLKGTADFVSHVDEEAQAAALGVIRERHPDHAIVAEEGDGAGKLPDDGRPCWIVDPLDGTTNFLHGHPMVAASVGLAVDGRAVVGVVECAPTGERWWATAGGGAWKNGLPVRVSSTDRLEAALVATGFPFKRMEAVEHYAGQLVRVLEGSAGVRRCGAAALDLAYLAEGRFDAFWELFLNVWDFAAGVVLIDEAGGMLERVEGGPLGLEKGSVMGANGPALLDALRARVSSRHDERPEG